MADKRRKKEKAEKRDHAVRTDKPKKGRNKTVC
jgi:hypothetical protein